MRGCLRLLVIHRKLLDGWDFIVTQPRNHMSTKEKQALITIEKAVKKGRKGRETDVYKAIEFLSIVGPCNRGV